MTVEIEYRTPSTIGDASGWQVDMAKQIESNRGYNLSDIDREISGTTLIVRVQDTLPSTTVENTKSDIEDFIDSNSVHVETREV